MLDVSRLMKLGWEYDGNRINGMLPQNEFWGHVNFMGSTM